MNVSKIAGMNFRPTNKKMEKAKMTAEKLGILPKEMPLEKKVYLESPADSFEKIKDEIQISINNMRGTK